MITRLFRFGVVGLLCLLIQILILLYLEQFTVPVIANMIGFIASAQLNFLLSYRFTWSDSARKNGFALATTWFKFNLVVLLSALINAVAFYLLSSMLVGLPAFNLTETASHAVAATGATIISTTCTFLINHLIVLKPEKRGENHDRTAGNSNVPARVE